MAHRKITTRHLAGIGTLAVAILALAGSAAPAVAAERCQAKNSRTEEASRYARVYSVRRIQDDAVTRRWYGCLYSSGRRVRLGDVGPSGQFSDRISPVRLAGRHVAYASEYTASTGDALGAVVQVRDLRTGAFVRRFQSPGDPNTYDVTDLELRTNGSVAWIARIIAGTPARTSYEVRLFPTSQAQASIADAGPTLGARSLALSAGTLYWTRDGAARSAVLR